MKMRYSVVDGSYGVSNCDHVTESLTVGGGGGG